MHRQHPQDQIITLQVAILARRLQVFAIALGLTVVLVGAGHLVAWLSGLLGEASLHAFIMKTNLALCLLLLGAGLALVVGCGETPLRRWCARIAASLALVIGALTLGENVFGWDLGIDQLLASEPPGALGVVSPNRMGLPASASVVVISMGLLAMSGRGRRAVCVAQGLALGVCVVAVLGITGHLYGVRTLYAVARLTAIAWPSAASLLALGTGLLLVRPTEGVMAQVTADDPGGVSLRRWLPVLPLPLALGYLSLLGERGGIFDAATGTALTMILFIAALAVIAYTGARAVSQSATARAAADEARRRSDERLALAASATQIGMFDWNLTRRTVLWTQAHEAIFGYAPATTTTTTTTTTEHDYHAWADRLHPEDMPRVEEEVHRCQQERKPLEVQYRIIWPDGSVHWVESKGIFLYDNDGKAERMLGVVMDITERKRVEEALRQSEDKFFKLFEKSPVPLSLATMPEGVLYDVNRAWLDLFGYTGNDEVVGKTSVELGITPEPAQRARIIYEFQEKGFVRDAEIEAVSGDGRRRTILINMDSIEIAGRKFNVATHQDITERKRAEEQISRSQKTFSELVERAPFGIYIVDSKFRIAQMNVGSQDGAFRNARPVIGRDLAEAMRILWPEPVAAEILGHFRHTLDTGEPYFSQDFIRTRGDSEIVEAYEWELHRISLPDGQYGVTCYYFDSTKLREAEEALRENEERLRLTLQAGGMGMFEVDLSTGKGTWNDVEYELLGIRPGDAAPGPETFFRFVLPDDVAQVRALWEQGLRTGSFDAEFRIARADCQERWLAGTGRFIGSGTNARVLDGPAPRFLGVNYDITGRKRAEEAAAAAHTQTQGIIDNATSIIYAFDLEGRFLLANAAVAKVLNTTPEQMIGRRRHEFMPKADADWHEANDRQAIEAGKALEFEEASQLPGRPITWLTTKFPLRDAQGKIYAVAGISADISERKRADEALRRAVEELQRSNKELEQFAYISAHDLQEPLRQVRAYVGRLKDLHADKFEGKAAQYFDFVHDGAARMSELVRGLLEYSRVGSRKVVHQPTASDQALDAALANLQAGIDESRAVITHDGLPIVMAEPTQLAQLFQNLIGNAIKFRSPDRPCQVHVAARKLDGHWEFSVRDNGVGIDQQFHEKVFVIFQRLHTREQYPGTGIGLAICKKIVEWHGGRIWIESKVGEGTTFFFTLSEASSR